MEKEGETTGIEIEGTKIPQTSKKDIKKTSKPSKRRALHAKANLNELYVKHDSHINIYIKRAHKLIKEG